MSTITRGWLAFAAIGTALIHLALVVGSPLPLGVVYAAMGAAELAWGVAAMTATRLPTPRLALTGALIPLLLWMLLLASAVTTQNPAVAAAVPLLPLAVATLFELLVAGTIAVHLRRSGAVAHNPKAPSAGKYLLGLMVGSLLVAGLTTPALAATEAGRLAQPHGEHSDEFVVDDSHRTGH